MTPTTRRPVRIIATRHEETSAGVRVSRVLLDEPPVAYLPAVDSVLGGWWFRAGGYPVGRDYGITDGGRHSP